MVEDEKPSSKSRKVVIEATHPEDYLHEAYDKEEVQKYLIEKLGSESYQEKYEGNSKKQVTVDVKVRNPSINDDKNVTKRIDVDVKVKDDRQDGYFGDDIPDPRKYNIKVKISKDPPRAEDKNENLLLKLVKSARKYAGF